MLNVVPPITGIGDLLICDAQASDTGVIDVNLLNWYIAPNREKTTNGVSMAENKDISFAYIAYNTLYSAGHAACNVTFAFTETVVARAEVPTVFGESAYYFWSLIKCARFTLPITLITLY